MTALCEQKCVLFLDSHIVSRRFSWKAANLGQRLFKRRGEDIPVHDSQEEWRCRKHQKHVSNPTVLSFSNVDHHYTVNIDLSKTKSAYLLLGNYQDGPISSAGYESLVLSEAKQNLATTHKEYLAVLFI